MHQVITTVDFDAWLAGLTAAERGNVERKIAYLRRVGPRLGRPHADTLVGSRHTNMKELRAGTGTAVLRIAYAFDPGRDGILLTAGDKAGVSEKRFYKKLIAKADLLYDHHLAKLKKEP